MRRIHIITILGALIASCALGLTAVAGGKAAAPAPGDVMIEGMYAAALLGAREGDPEQVTRALQRAMDDQIFGQLSPGKKREVALMYGHAAAQLREWPQAHRGFVLAIEAGDKDSETWLMRLHTAISAGDAADSYRSFSYMAARGPVLSTFILDHMERLDQLLRSLADTPDARLALGRQLEHEDWKSPYVFADPSVLRLHYVEALLEAGDTRTATAVAGRITDPMVMMAMLADRRFDAVVAANPGLQNPQAAAERKLQQARDYVAANPRLMSGQLAVVEALEVQGRQAEGLQIVDQIIRTATTAPRSRPPFDDMELRESAEYVRSSLLISVGRTDEAIGARVAAASCHCSPSAVLALSRTLMQDARPQEAQRWLAEAPAAGLDLREQMELSQIRACVAAQVGDKPAVGRELEILRRHESWRPDALLDALVCAERLDEAEQVLVKQLDDPRVRLAALSRLQTYTKAESRGRYDHVMRERWSRLGARPAVRARALAVGRLNSFPLMQFAPI